MQNQPLKVARDFIFCKKKGKNRKISYTDVQRDKEDWVDSKKYLPADFDLVQVITKKNSKFNAWACGNKWDGFRIQSDDEVLFWKYKK